MTYFRGTHNFSIMKKTFLIISCIAFSISVFGQKQVEIITDGTQKLIVDSTGHILIKNTGNSVFLGDNAGKSDDLSSNFNVFLGHSAGRENTIGVNNTAVGYSAMRSNISGYRNVVIGRRALENDTSGHYNIAIGDVALLSNKNGEKNVAVGASAGQGNKGSGNVFLGYQAGMNELGDNRFYIHNSGSSFPLLYGEFDSKLIRINGTLNLDGKYTFPAVDGAPDQVLKTDGSGNLIWGADKDGLWSDGANEIFYSTSNKDVAIGQSTANGKLHVRQTTSQDGMIIDHDYVGSSGIEGLSINMPASATGDKKGIVVQSVGSSSPSSTGILSYTTAGTGDNHQAIWGQTSGASTAIRGTAFDASGKAADFSGLSEFHGRTYFDGNVGIGTEAPLSNLHVHESIESLSSLYITAAATDFNDSSLVFFAEDTDATYGMYWLYDGGGNEMELWGKSAATHYGPHIRIDRADGLITLKDGTIIFNPDVNGAGRITTDEIEIKGGSDLAEYFSSGVSDKQDFEPGSIVCVGEHDGQVTLSQKRSDKKVIGVVSGANGVKTGMLLGQKGTLAYGDIPVAITGRVYTKASNENGDIEPGDFITTSSQKGIAMKVTDFDASRGAILGKALTSVKDGFVLVLIGLQ